MSCNVNSETNLDRSKFVSLVGTAGKNEDTVSSKKYVSTQKKLTQVGNLYDLSA